MLVEAALVVEVDAEGLGRVLARAWTALQLTANLLPSMLLLLLVGWGGETRAAEGGGCGCALIGKAGEQ